MKKIFFTILTLIFFANAKACDICGCGVGGNYIGILPDFKSRILGLRYRYNSLRTHIGINGATTYLTTNESYHTAEIWGGWNIGKKLRFMAALPYSFNERHNQDGTNKKNGVGDISVTGYYKLVNSKRSLQDKLLVQSLYVGGGVKIPTGKYKPEDKENSARNTNLFQLGTGSVDFTLNAMYDMRLQDFGLNLSVSYKINNVNKYAYSYGNKLNTSAQLYYKFAVKKKVTIAPNAGIVYEQAKKDIDDNFWVDISGGNLLSASAGIEATEKKISIGANYQIPVAQNLAAGFVKANSRMMVHISFVL